MKVKRQSRKILKSLGCDNPELSILFTSDEYIKELNKKFRKKNKPTDVLAFAQNEGDFAEINQNILGDVIISAETARRQAKEKKHSIEKEILILLIHGMLHLVGYDHEKSKQKAEAMRLKEEELLTLLSTSAKTAK